jgi:aminopeptidase-like protein
MSGFAEGLTRGLDQQFGHRMHADIAALFPIPRSITGPGVRATLDYVAHRIPLTLHEVPSGTRVYDWTVPLEWSVIDAFVATPDGTRIVDFQKHNLHLVAYSTPVDTTMTLDELAPHLHSLPEQPNLVPFRNAYYSNTWGFCVSHAVRQQMRDDVAYRVVVDTSLEPGSLTYGECVLPGDVEDEVLLSTHTCHPSLANDNLTGIVLLTVLGQLLSTVEHRLTYRLVFVPGTIGSLVWLSRNQTRLEAVKHGLVLTGLGGPGPLIYKRSRHGRRAVDRAAELVIGPVGEIRDFSPWGYDERQYNSPGFDLAVGRLTRTPHGEYPEYHTSGDNLSFVTPSALVAALRAVVDILDALESDATYVNQSPYGEPSLGKRALYPSIGGEHAQDQVMAMLWMLNQSDGEHSLLDIAERSGVDLSTLRDAAAALCSVGLLIKEG